MHYVYVLYSTFDHGMYIGYSANLRRRLGEHRLGLSAATRHRRPWRLAYCEPYLDPNDAISRERFLKSGAGRTYLKGECRHFFASNPLRSAA
jgi:putative endonuclease